jgi:Ca2+-binding EF-hand superfamily protein
MVWVRQASDDDQSTAIRSITQGKGGRSTFITDEEEQFDSGMRNMAMDIDSHLTDYTRRWMEFDEFAGLMRGREVGVHTDEELRARFAAIDEDKSGKIDRDEFVYFAIQDVLSRAADRAMDVFRRWDADGSGILTEREFKLALASLGFDKVLDPSEMKRLIAKLDGDGDGTISYLELKEKMRADGVGGQRKLRSKQDVPAAVPAPMNFTRGQILDLQRK